MGPTSGPSGTDRTQMGPMLAPWTLLSGVFLVKFNTCIVWIKNQTVFFYQETAAIYRGCNVHVFLVSWHHIVSIVNSVAYILNEAISRIWTCTNFEWGTGLLPCAIAIDLFHKSHNARVPYPTMHQFVKEMHFLLQNCTLWDICLILCVIFVVGLKKPLKIIDSKWRRHFPEGRSLNHWTHAIHANNFMSTLLRYDNGWFYTYSTGLLHNNSEIAVMSTKRNERNQKKITRLS